MAEDDRELCANSIQTTFFAPDAGSLEAESVLQILVESLNLSIRLWVEARGEAEGDPKQPAELCPEPSCELWAIVGNDITGEAMKLEDVKNENLSGLFSRWEFG